LIVAREKTGGYGFFDESLQSRKTRRHRAVFGGEKLAITGFIFAIFLVGVFVIYYYSQLFTLGYQITRLNKELAVLRVENHSLDEEVQQLVSLDNIEYLAVHKLNMVKPDADNFLVVTVADPASRELTAQAKEEESQPVVLSWGEKGKSRLIKTFDELVNRFDNKTG